MKTRPWQTSWHLKQSEWVCLESRKQTWTSCLEKTPESSLSSLTALWPERRSMCVREKWWRKYILDGFFNSLALTVTVISQAAVKKTSCEPKTTKINHLLDPHKICTLFSNFLCWWWKNPVLCFQFLVGEVLHTLKKQIDSLCKTINHAKMCIHLLLTNKLYRIKRIF